MHSQVNAQPCSSKTRTLSRALEQVKYKKKIINSLATSEWKVIWTDPPPRSNTPIMAEEFLSTPNSNLHHNLHPDAIGKH